MIKKTAFVLLMGIFAACGNSVNQADTPGIETQPDAKKVLSSNADPICEMEKDATWTDFALNEKGDTVWFCSATCKDAFVAKQK